MFKRSNQTNELRKQDLQKASGPYSSLKNESYLSRIEVKFYSFLLSRIMWPFAAVNYALLCIPILYLFKILYYAFFSSGTFRHHSPLQLSSTA